MVKSNHHFNYNTWAVLHEPDLAKKQVDSSMHSNQLYYVNLNYLLWISTLPAYIPLPARPILQDRPNSQSSSWWPLLEKACRICSGCGTTASYLPPLPRTGWAGFWRFSPTPCRSWLCIPCSQPYLSWRDRCSTCQSLQCNLINCTRIYTAST